ncbi:MAG TPA: hypothetical protein VJQ82_09120 [Terriglobales bacterium]|nr:hypothetical protein [Terriglobales bacterium]
MASVSSKNKNGIYVAWKTVTYRSVVLMIMGALAILVAGMHFAFPHFTDTGVKAVGNLGSHILEAIAGAAGTPARSGTMSSQQAHITALDGTVRVKKSNSNSWMTADYSVPLEKGDVIQTGPEGMAKIVFNDGTNYTVKQDSLIVIEENSANEQQTTVAVAVSTGTVDLSTATFSQGSKSQVIVDGATASLAPESAAMVHNDPKSDKHEILLKKGSGDVSRNGETVRLSDWEKVSFNKEAPKMEKLKEIGPPTPISPANMMPIFGAGDPKPIEFSWTKMPNAVGYRLKISRNPYFSSMVVDRKVATADVEVSGLAQGAYYWLVQSFDGAGKESVESEKNRFTLIPKEKDSEAINLDLDPLIQHGHVIELTGKTEVGARVMVNGREVPIVSGDGSFHFFTTPLPQGENVITITAQDSKGGVNTLQKKVVIQ